MLRKCSSSLLSSSHDKTPRNSILNFIKKFIYATINAFCNKNRWKKEWSILRPQLWQIPFLVAIHFCHSTATNIAYYMHIQSETLQDIGFTLIPEITIDNELRDISEYIFLFIFISGMLLSLTSFYFIHPIVYTCELWMRTIKVTVVIVILRSITFLATSLPGPGFHCIPYAFEYKPPEDWYAVFFTMDIFHGCGDLLFSSHVSLALCFVVGMHIYLPQFFGKIKGWMIVYCIYWPMMILMGVIIIGSRKHYTVDVLVAFYVTPLVYYASYKFYKDVNAECLKGNKKFGEEKRKMSIDSGSILGGMGNDENSVLIDTSLIGDMSGNNHHGIQGNTS